MPIPHYRYCGPDRWLVVRGKADVKLAEAIKLVSTEVINNKLFMGRRFSAADEYIYQTAMGMNAGGNASTWRQMNTVHHLTVVMRDLGKIYGFEIKEMPAEELAEQLELVLA